MIPKTLYCMIFYFSYSCSSFSLWLSMFLHDKIATATTCNKVNCTAEVINGFQVSYLSLQKYDDMKMNHFTATETYPVSGKTKEARQRECADKCMKEGKSFCRSADLTPFGSNGPSTCNLYSEDVYNHWLSVQNSMRSSSSGWTAFHLVVRWI